MNAMPAKVRDDDAARYRALVNAVTDYAIYMLDPNGVVISWNPGAERFKGYTEQEIIGQHFSRFYTPGDIESGLPVRALQTAAREGKFENEGWRVRRDGTRFWAHVVIDPIRASDGTLTGFAKITRDLTERRAAEESLRRSQEQFRLLVQGVTDYAIYMLDPNGIITNWNMGAQRIKGYTPDEIIGQHFSRFYIPQDRERGEPQRALDIAMREGRFEKEGLRMRKDGTQFWCHVVIDVIRDDNGEVIGFAKITRDISERRKAQLSLEQAREALFQSQKMDAVGQLTGGVAHDFNNLLMAVLGSLELMKKRLPDDAQLNRLLDNAILGAKRGASLTQRMLAFARRQELNVVSIDLPKLVGGMAELLQRSLDGTTDLDIQVPASLQPVVADANQLELALLNLTVNARDAMPAGGRIQITAREATVAAKDATGLAPGAYVCLSVRDNGEGMDADTLARATEPFFTTKGVGKGTGLGLSMVHGMTEQIGGRLILTSEPGKGTEAQIWLPVADDLSQPEPAPAADAQSAANQGLKVLAVDDDALVLFNTTAMLEDLGHAVIEARSGEEALGVLAREKIDVLITDQAMPKMTGVQLLEAVKSRWPGLPAILATGYAEIPGGQAVDVVRLGKPFSQSDLTKAIAQLCLDKGR